MSLLDELGKALEKTDVDDKLLEKFGIEGGITAKQIKEVEAVAKKSGVDLEKINVAEIAAKVGVDEKIVKKILGKTK